MAAGAVSQINLERVHAAPGTPATITLEFKASLRLKNYLARSLSRLNGVKRVRVSAV